MAKPGPKSMGKAIRTPGPGRGSSSPPPKRSKEGFDFVRRLANKNAQKSEPIDMDTIDRLEKSTKRLERDLKKDVPRNVGEQSWRVSAGSIIRFTYKHHTGVKPGEPVDDFKEVFVLNRNYQGKLHGLDMKRMNPAEAEVIRAVFDTQVQTDFLDGKQHRIPLVNDIFRRMDPNTEIQHATTFYQTWVKPMLRSYGDVYRTYFFAKMWNISIVQPSALQGKVFGRGTFKNLGSRGRPMGSTKKTEEEKEQEHDKAVKRAQEMKQMLAQAKIRKELIAKRAQELSKMKQIRLRVDKPKVEKPIIRKAPKPK